MDSQWLPGSGDPWILSLVCGLLAFITLYCYSTWTYDEFRKLNIPGPRPLPLVGNLGHVLREEPTKWQIEYAKQYGKVYGLYFGRTPHLVVADPDIIKEITVKQFHCFTNRSSIIRSMKKPLDRVLNGLQDEHWKHVRGAITPVFTSGKLKKMMDTIARCASGLSSYIEQHEGENIDVKEISSAFSMDVIAGTAFGLDVRALENPKHPFLQNARAFFSFASNKNVKKTIALAASVLSLRLGRILEAFGIEVIDQKCVAYVENVLAPLLTKHDSIKDETNFVHLCADQLVELESVPKDSIKTSGNLVWTTAGLLSEDITSNAVLFIMAGHETTSSLLATFFYSMAMNQHVQEKLSEEIAKVHDKEESVTYDRLKDMQYLDWCIDETLRMYPPLVRTERHCSETITIGGVCIRSGMVVYIPVYAVHHDPKVWPSPFEFRPERFSPDESKMRPTCAYIPFGSGPRNCIGMRLALLEAKAAIASVLLRYIVRPCKDTQVGPLRWSKGHVTLCPANPIVLNFARRNL